MNVRHGLNFNLKPLFSAVNYLPYFLYVQPSLVERLSQKCVPLSLDPGERSCWQCDSSRKGLWWYLIFKCGCSERLPSDVVGRHIVQTSLFQACWTLYGCTLPLLVVQLLEGKVNNHFGGVLWMSLDMCRLPITIPWEIDSDIVWCIHSLLLRTHTKKKFSQNPCTACPTNAAPVAEMERAQVTWSNTGGMLSGSAHLVQK